MIRYASSEDTLRKLSNPRAIKLKLFGNTGNFKERQRREALGGSGGIPPPQNILKSESLKTQFPALSGRWPCQKCS